MCYDYELKYRIYQEEKARQAKLKAEDESRKPRPAAPAAAPQTPAKELEPLPV